MTKVKKYVAKEGEKGIRVNVYRPLVECFNCGLFESVPINYGKLIKDEECPNCKCKTLDRATKPNFEKTNYVTE